MRFRIGAMIELVFVVAIGFGYYDFCHRQRSLLGQNYWSLVGSIINASQGMVIAVGLCVLVQRLRRVGPESWGIGRATAVSFTAALILYVAWATHILLIYPLRPGRPSAFERNLLKYSLSAWYEACNQLTAFVPGICLAAWLSRTAGSGQPDATEWTGRVAVGFLILFSGIVPLVRAFYSYLW